MWTIYVGYISGGQKVAYGPLELELQGVMGHYVGARTPTQIFCKSKFFEWLSHGSSPLSVLYFILLMV